eukprot:GHVU01097083.1.p1 GENE.GHVU01097083.1~~GHVU01097083.1.p1  ORF type:complete len:101 (-),score=4.20 GHVU01097083.1:415-717(-)
MQPTSSGRKSRVCYYYDGKRVIWRKQPLRSHAFNEGTIRAVSMHAGGQVPQLSLEADAGSLSFVDVAIAELLGSGAQAHLEQHHAHRSIYRRSIPEGSLI